MDVTGLKFTVTGGKGCDLDRGLSADAVAFKGLITSWVVWSFAWHPRICLAIHVFCDSCTYGSTLCNAFCSQSVRLCYTIVCSHGQSALRSSATGDHSQSLNIRETPPSECEWSAWRNALVVIRFQIIPDDPENGLFPVW